MCHILGTPCPNAAARCGVCVVYLTQCQWRSRRGQYTEFSPRADRIRGESNKYAIMPHLGSGMTRSDRRKDTFMTAQGSQGREGEPSHVGGSFYSKSSIPTQSSSFIFSRS
jgi:hypothetical protein